MSNADEELLAKMLEDVQANMKSLQDAYQQRAQLTGTGTAAGKRVTVVVNADGLVVDTTMTDGIEDLTPTELARAVTAAAQQAHAELGRKTEELVAPMRERHAAVPKLSEFLPGLPDELSSLPVFTKAATGPLDSEESDARRKDAGGTGGTGPQVTEPGW
ncbi:YbaB/EbfC family nucleoid-associated protein [Nocardia sp. 2YAB30]|uniref:YbaB/EbfC family nucleoid-associated protein n=1 Tax=unclassified Nocardia TaxID=2637762 RepID=UPI003F9A698D